VTYGWLSVLGMLFLQFPGCIDESVVKIAGLLAEMQAGNQENMKQTTVTICVPIFRMEIFSVVHVPTAIQ
jgi:hypothetical protein